MPVDSYLCKVHTFITERMRLSAIAGLLEKRGSPHRRGSFDH